MTRELAIETRGLVKRFGARTAVAGIDLEVPAGCAFGFLGPNGAGKTTVIRLLLGLTEATAGEMRLLGRPVPGERRAALARVGAIVEEPRFHRHLTGRENLRLNAAARGGRAGARIDDALERVRLRERADARVATYSLGMRQRLGIARCLLADPALLILDEPLNGLDPAGHLEFRALIRELVAEGRTVFLSSHLLDEIERTCDRAAIVDGGLIVEQLALSDLAAAATGVLAIDCDPAPLATSLLTPHAFVRSVEDAGEGSLRVTLAAGADVAALNRLLVESGVAVRRLQPMRTSLEDRFLTLTSSEGAL